MPAAILVEELKSRAVQTNWSVLTAPNTVCSSSKEEHGTKQFPELSFPKKEPAATASQSWAGPGIASQGAKWQEKTGLGSQGSRKEEGQAHPDTRQPS